MEQSFIVLAYHTQLYTGVHVVHRCRPVAASCDAHCVHCRDRSLHDSQQYFPCEGPRKQKQGLSRVRNSAWQCEMAVRIPAQICRGSEHSDVKRHESISAHLKCTHMSNAGARAKRPGARTAAFLSSFAQLRNVSVECSFRTPCTTSAAAALEPPYACASIVRCLATAARLAMHSEQVHWLSDRKRPTLALLMLRKVLGCFLEPSADCLGTEARHERCCVELLTRLAFEMRGVTSREALVPTQDRRPLCNA